MIADYRNPLDRINPFLPPHLSRYLTDGVDLVELITISKHVHAVRSVLSTYLPRYLVGSILQDPEPGRVSGSFKNGAVLFADVSGFTAMSEKLSVLGKEGAEEVTGIVNEYFTAMLEINDSFGGDLLKFGGDALLVFFEGDLGPQRALATSQAMMDAMNRFTQVKTSQGVFPLRMKIGMACGPVFLASVGTPESMDHAVMGSTLFDMAQAEHNATAGEIVVSSAVKEVTEEVASYSPIEEGFWKLQESKHKEFDLSKIPREQYSPALETGFDPDILVENMLREADLIRGMRPFVPDELFSRIINDPQRITVYGSHRPVTVTFTNFIGIDEIIDVFGPPHTEAITTILNNHFVTMSEVINRFGGTVNRLDAYSVGHRILALFGALQAHEDDPQRAVRAALEMNKSLQEVNQEARDILSACQVPEVRVDSTPLKQRIGVNSGFVFAGNTGSHTRREYTVMGDQVNLTARLMGIAEQGEVLIGESTAKHIEEVFSLNEKEAVKVKGKSKPVRNFAVEGVVERTHWKTRLTSNPIVGRENELNLGKDAVEQSINGEGRVLVVSGVSGMGKTRLAEELAWYGDSKGMDLLVGTCLSYGKTMTYHPWAEVLRELFGINLTDQSQDADQRIAAVQRGLAAVDEEPWSPVIGAVLGLDIPDNELTRDLDPKLRRQRVLDLTVKLLRSRASRNPLMLVIEDAHWADPASMDMIDYVARNIKGQPILFMLPHRPDIGLPDWIVYSHAVAIELADLSEKYCKEIIHDMLGGLQLPEAMYNVILSRGCGNPFFIGEVVRALIDAGALEKDSDGSFHIVEDMSQVELPDSIHGVIISRIDRLVASDRRILQVASVIGRVFAYQTLDGVYPYEDIETALKGRLNYLNELGLTEIQVIETELYRFIHLTTREVVYDGLPFEYRRSLHRKIGGYIEDTSAGSLGEQTSLLAYHYYEGHAWEKAMNYNLIAAQNAQREFANDTAILSGQRALEAANNLGPEVDTSQVRIKAHETLGEVMTLVGQYDEAFEQYGQARDLVANEESSPQRQAHLAELSRKTAEVYERRSEYDTAFEWLEKGLQYLDEDQVSVEIADIYFLIAGVYHRQAKNEQASQWCLRSIAIASQINTLEGRRSLAKAYRLEGAVQYRLGNLRETVELCSNSLKIFQEIKDVIGEAVASNNLSNAYAELGEWGQAYEALQRSRQIYQRVGDVFGQGYAANNLAYIHLERGEWDQAKYLFIESNQIWKKIGATSPDAVSLSNLAQVYIYQENWDQAGETLTESQALFDKIGSDDFRAELERRWGEYYLGVGDIEQALNHTQLAVEVAQEQEAPLDWGLSLRVLGEIYLQQGVYKKASQTLQESLSILNELGNDYEVAKTSLVMTRVSLKEGVNVNRETLERIIQIFSDLNAKADLLQAQNLLKQID